MGLAETLEHLCAALRRAVADGDTYAIDEYRRSIRLVERMIR